MSFAAPIFLWALLGIPLVILLHFLRIQRTRRDVAALFLWREARDLAEARRRISPTWLLLAQILFVAAAALALAQPQLSVAGPPDAVLVIDASASMAALEGAGTTRLDLARAEAREVAGRSGRVALVRAGLDVVVVHPLDGDRGAFANALAGLEAGDRTADLERAIDLAEDVASGGPVHVFTDTDVGARAGLVVHPVGGAVGNTGIVAFDVGLQEAFVAVASNADRPQEVALTLSRDGAEVASTSLFVPVGGQGTVTFPLTESGIYEARLTPPSGDALALDDVAYAGRGELIVALDRPNEPLQRALGSIPAVSVRVTGQAATVDADVRVLTGADPAELEMGRYLLLAAPAVEPDYRVVRDVDRSHPLMRFVDVREAVVGIAPERVPEAAADAAPGGTPESGAGAAGDTAATAPPDDASAGWTVLATDASLTPLIRFREGPELQILQLAFHPSQTDMVLRPGFPALIANAVRAFRGEERLPLGSQVPAGPDDAMDRRVLEPGVVVVNGRSRPVSLLSAAETRLTEPPTATTAEAPTAPATASERARELAPWLLAIAAALLAAEWLLARRSGWWALQRR